MPFNELNALYASLLYALGVPAIAKDQCMHIPSNLKFDHFKGGTEV